MAGEVNRIGEGALAALGSADAEPVVSVVTIWEIAIKRSRDKLDGPGDLLAQLEAAGVELLPVTARHADFVYTLPHHHGDPFDRLLVSQAMLEGLPLLTGDKVLSRYDVEVVW